MHVTCSERTLASKEVCARYYDDGKVFFKVIDGCFGRNTAYRESKFKLGYVFKQIKALCFP